MLARGCLRRVALRASVAAALTLSALGAARAAEPGVMRIATVAPDGTSWSREMKAWARDVDEVTNGQLRIKLYFGGIAGNEQQVLERLRRDQLDGTIGSEICTQLARRSRSRASWVCSRTARRTLMSCRA